MNTDPQTEWGTHLQLSNENIGRHRRGQARLRFVSSSGEPLKHLPVQVTQKTQYFLFGNLIFDLLWGDPPYKPDLFKQRFLELFNLAIFPFYGPYYEPKPGQTQWQKMLPVLEWCRANGVTPKGHPLVWPYTVGVSEWLYDKVPALRSVVRQDAHRVEDRGRGPDLHRQVHQALVEFLVDHPARPA